MGNILITALIAILLLISPTPCQACWGTRPLAMGGAFSGVADDGNAIYWNPAGLALSGQVQISTMHNIGAANDSNYDQYVGMVIPTGNYGALGLAYVYNKDFLYRLNGRKYGFLRDEYWQIGYGIFLDKDRSVSLGMSFKAVATERNTGVRVVENDWYDLDFGGMWLFGKTMGKSKMFSLGFLLQNASEAQFMRKDSAAEMIRNLRPGLSFRPDEKTVLSVELYDALGKTKNSSEDVSRDVRLGIERQFTDYFVLRAGVYHVNNDIYRAYTGGIGIKPFQRWDIDLELEWTIMLWDKSRTYTHFAGVVYRY
ncbi:MAG: hypothetical protein HZA78_10425 [Candidatus Schekmanbacteria bacterium]|nr:hypothetical protein [Candidatus Schekmanbacteria bacterium]